MCIGIIKRVCLKSKFVDFTFCNFKLWNLGFIYGLGFFYFLVFVFSFKVGKGEKGMFKVFFICNGFEFL